MIACPGGISTNFPCELFYWGPLDYFDKVVGILFSKVIGFSTTTIYKKMIFVAECTENDYKRFMFETTFD